MNERRKKLCQGLFYLGIFGFLFLWFSRIHALVVFDADDWTYLAYVRATTPVWGEWNPAKVFPEVVYPFVSTLAAYLLTPLTRDYITAQTIMHALVVSLAITGYLWCFSRLLRRSFPVSRLSASLLTALFLLLHFLALRGQERGNQYLFYCVDLNCYYNYLLPELLNASLVMCLTANPRLQTFLTRGAPAARGCFAVAVYFAIFSNLPASGILAAYAGSTVLVSLLGILRRKSPKGFWRENGFSLLILAAWLVSAVFELSGGRAASAGSSTPLYYRLFLSAKYLAGVLLECSRLFQVSVCLILLGFCAGALAARKKGAPVCPWLGTLLIAGAAMGVYLLALSAAVNPATIRRSENLFGLFFLGSVCLMGMLAFLVSRYPKMLLVLPLLTVFLLSGVDTREDTFLESNFAGLRPALCAQVSRDLIRQMQAADEAGASQVELRVPVYVSDPQTQDNWPHSLQLMSRIGDTLYAHGVIHRHIQVKPVADPDMNARYQIPLPGK